MIVNSIDEIFRSIIELRLLVLQTITFYCVSILKFKWE